MASDQTTAALTAERPLASDDDRRAWRPMLTQIRRLITLGMKAGRPWDSATNVGEIASACRVDPERVVHLIRSCGWLVSVVEEPGKPIAEWEVFEDGE